MTLHQWHLNFRSSHTKRKKIPENCASSSRWTLFFCLFTIQFHNLPPYWLHQTDLCMRIFHSIEYNSDAWCTCCQLIQLTEHKLLTTMRTKLMTMTFCCFCFLFSFLFQIAPSELLTLAWVVACLVRLRQNIALVWLLPTLQVSFHAVLLSFALFFQYGTYKYCSLYCLQVDPAVDDDPRSPSKFNSIKSCTKCITPMSFNGREKEHKPEYNFDLNAWILVLHTTVCLVFSVDILFNTIWSWPFYETFILPFSFFYFSNFSFCTHIKLMNI